MDRRALGLLVLRVFAGLSLALAHGLGKLPPSPRFLAGVSSMGFPAPALFAWVSALVEFGGGLLLALGLFSRPAAALIAANMAVAVLVAHAADPFTVREMALLYGVIALAFALVGPGAYAVDARRNRRGA